MAENNQIPRILDAMRKDITIYNNSIGSIISEENPYAKTNASILYLMMDRIEEICKENPDMKSEELFKLIANFDSSLKTAMSRFIEMIPLTPAVNSEEHWVDTPGHAFIGKEMHISKTKTIHVDAVDVHDVFNGVMASQSIIRLNRNNNMIMVTGAVNVMETTLDSETNERKIVKQYSITPFIKPDAAWPITLYPAITIMRETDANAAEDEDTEKDYVRIGVNDPFHRVDNRLIHENLDQIMPNDMTIYLEDDEEETAE